MTRRGETLDGVNVLTQVVAWLIALAWVLRMGAAVWGIPRLPDLRLPEHDRLPAGLPSITIIVPARNESGAIRACLESLIAQDYAPLQIIAVNDRSTDATGTEMDSLVSPRLRVLHITELPAEWLGKTHAMASAAALAETDFLLFTDADILFSPDAIRRALANAVETNADHLVLAPTTIIKRWDEAAVISFFQVFSLWAARPWKVADPKALRDAIGVGAFNLVRTSAYRQVGGFEALRMEIVEDLGLARRIKLTGLAQRFVYGRDMVSLHWAAGMNGIADVMTKNVFAVFRYRIAMVAVGCVWLAVFCILPFFAVWSTPFTLPAALVIGALAAGYIMVGRHSGLNAWNVLFAPFGAAFFIVVLLRSMVITLRQGGVVWRGTFYPLAELRRHATPMVPRR